LAVRKKWPAREVPQTRSDSYYSEPDRG